MKNMFFYLLTVCIWGSTWIGIKMQLGVVDPVVSVAYRFGLASFLLFLWCLILGYPMRFSTGEHGRMAVQGVLLFGANYLFFYIAEQHITSGLTAVLFSTILIMNMVNGAIFLKKPLDVRVCIGGGVGLMGICLVFNQEITDFTLADSGVQGGLYCLLATLFASLGNIISASNQMRSLPIVQTNAYGMAYGGLAMFLLATFGGKEFTVDPSFQYLGAMLYLVIFGSIIAFGCYLTLVGNIGADRAAYATLLFPIVALFISTYMEGYQWTISSLTGVALILLGNLCMLQKSVVVEGMRSLIFPLRRSSRGKYLLGK